MTSELRVALYVEGNTDQQFLPAIVRRLLRNILKQANVEVAEPGIILPEVEITDNRAAKILKAAQKAARIYDILVVHSDVDNRGWQPTYDQLFLPGKKLIEEATLQSDANQVCQQVIPLLPERCVEAWMLADTNSLRKLINTAKSVKDLGLLLPKDIERNANPKKILNDAIRIANEDRPQRRRRQLELSMLATIYTNMGNKAELSALRQLPSFQKFEEALSTTLQELGFITL